ncbi:MAG: PhoX family phosphatase, partial [Burkholderiaceae bacterium]
MKFDDDLPVNPSGNPHLNQLIERAVSRRAVLKSGFGLATLSFLGLSACGGGDGEAVAAPTEFGAVGTSSADRVVVPDGYRADALYRWGDPLTAAAPDFASDASQDWRAQEQQAGDNHDGMSFFPFRNTDGSPRSDAGLLVMNHEYINPEYFYQPGTDPDDWLLPFTLDKARKAQAAHGVSVVEVRRGSDGAWQYVRQSAYNRRITGYTPIELSGPAAGHELLRTAADPAGVEALGTLNNCANGATPWGTYLTCEENFNGYFGWNGDHTPTALENRYGLSAGGAGYRWHTVDARFDVEQNPNEPNRFGWIVEIDPMQPASKPKKRTALGRFKHENAEVVLAPDGRAVVYMGDDERNDYIYKFVSARRYDPS